MCFEFKRQKEKQKLSFRVYIFYIWDRDIIPVAKDRCDHKMGVDTESECKHAAEILGIFFRPFAHQIWYIFRVAKANNFGQWKQLFVIHRKLYVHWHVIKLLCLRLSIWYGSRN